MAIRRKNNLRLNVNLFRIFIMPLFRMALLNYHSALKTQKNSADKLLRMPFKRFTNLPKSTPNKLIRNMIGTLADRDESLF